MFNECKKIIKVTGGLGNQMFQISLALVLSEMKFNVSLDLSDYEIHFEHNGFEINSIFNIRIPKASKSDLLLLSDTNKDILNRIRRKLIGHKQSHIIECVGGFGYDSSGKCFLTTSSYLEGYWQSEKYFKDYSHIIKEKLSFNHSIIGQRNLDILNNIRNGNILGVHVRRGDYLKSRVHRDLTSSDYYDAAFNKINKHFIYDSIVVFTNDTEWVSDNFKHHNNLIVVDWNGGNNSWIDMYLMSCCKALIIANSSFSWWGGWLGNEKMVVATKQWFKHPNYSSLHINALGWHLI